MLQIAERVSPKLRAYLSGLDGDGLVSLLNMPTERLAAPASYLQFSGASLAELSPLLEGLNRVALSRLPLGALALFWVDTVVPLLSDTDESFWITNYGTSDKDVFVLYADRQGMWVSQSQIDEDGSPTKHTYAIVPENGWPNRKAFRKYFLVDPDMVCAFRVLMNRTEVFTRVMNDARVKP